MPETTSKFLDDFDNVLSQNISALHGLVKITEDQFLSIGQDLRDFRSETRKISRLSSSAGNALLEEKAVDAIAGLHTVLELMNERVRHSAELNRIVDALNGVLLKLVPIRDTQPEFRHMIKILRRLSVMTKIESAGIDYIERDFATIAVDIDALAKLIESKTNKLMGAEQSLTVAINAALNRTASLQAKERNIALSAIVKTETNLGALTQAHDQCSQMTQTLARDSDEISQLIGTVVESVQMQDIAAQRIIGVASVLEQVRSKVSELRQSMDATPALDVVAQDDRRAELFTICDGQLAELTHVRDGLIGAVDQIHGDLNRISENMGALVKETRGIVGTADKAGKSFFTEMEDDFDTVQATLSADADAELRFNITMGAVSTTGGNMADFIEDIEDIRAEIEVIALEARIKATRAGDQGAALFVIAESIHSLLEKTGALTTAIAGDLGEVVDTATHLRSGLRQDIDDDGPDSDVQKILDDLSRFMETFRDINDNIMGALSAMEEAVTTLATDVTRAVSDFTIDRVAPAIIDDITGKLGMLISPLEGEDARFPQRSVASAPMVGARTDTARGRRPDALEPPGLGANVELF